MNNIERIKQLYSAYKHRTISAEELDQFLLLIKSETESDDYLARMIEQDLLEEDILDDPIIHSILLKSEKNILARTREYSSFGAILKLRPYYIAAASVVILICASLLYFKNIHTISPTTVQNKSTSVEDILPGGNKAILKLSDGRNFSLDDSNNQISISEDAIILNNGNKLVDLPDQSFELELYTPRKGNYQAVLPDGTKVWLNAESKITYPSKFTDNIRVIQVEGEVYLEVAKVKDSKFIVELSNNRKIEVLGTKFNINAYSNHKYIKTSLLEGKVKLTNQHHKSAILTPGYKAIMSNGGNNISVFPTKLENDLAWLHNKFNFEDLVFEEIMQQIARWYDVEIVYETTIPNVEFYGELNKNNSLSYIIDVFKQSGVNMKIKSNKLIIE